MEIWVAFIKFDGSSNQQNALTLYMYIVYIYSYYEIFSFWCTLTRTANTLANGIKNDYCHVQTHSQTHTLTHAPSIFVLQLQNDNIMENAFAQKKY